MFRSALRFTTIMLAFLPIAAISEPIKLKLSFFTSDRSVAYQAAVKPFVDAINHDGKGLLQIEVYLSGTLGKVQRELPQLVLNGEADIAFIVPGQNPERFRDNTAVELPGLFRDAREATLVHTRLAAAGALAGYEDFFVIGAYGTTPESIHSRKTLASLADLKGQKIRTNNLTESLGLARFGTFPVVLAFNETSQAISGGMIDGATVPAAQLFDVGIGRLTNYHYMLQTSTAPLTLMINRKAFDRLPEDAKALIHKYSGEWTATHFFEAYARFDKDALEQIRADARRTIVVPSTADLKTAEAVFMSIRNDWAAASPHNHELLGQTITEISKLRAEE